MIAASARPQGSLGAKRLYLAVAACALLVHLGALWNQWAWDDVPIIYYNPLLHAPGALWRAFLSPYWPADLAGGLYRPLPIANYAIDLKTGSVAWLHAVNLLWHAGVSVLVAVLARRWSGEAAGWVAGLAFAVHPVHVEAVANIVGRAELMAALFALLAVYAALVCDDLWWSLAAFACGLLSKENAIVVVGLVMWGWVVGLARPSRRRALAYVTGWLVVGGAYVAIRSQVLSSLAATENVAAVFVGASPMHIRLTAIAATADVARLLLIPVTLRVDYSPAERTLVTSPIDARFLLGLGCVAGWVLLTVLAAKRGRKIEAFGLGWIGIAVAPVANLLFPTGVLVAERTLYLPSAGLALAAGAWLPTVVPRRWPALLALVVVAGGARAARRVPVWRDDRAVLLSELRDSPRSFDGPARLIGEYLYAHQPTQAVAAYRLAVGIYDRFAWLYMWGADAALTAGNESLADSALGRLEQLCAGCDSYYRFEATVARDRGDTAVARAIMARMPRSVP